MKSSFNNFLNSDNEYPMLSVFAAGLYPFLHYFNSNLHIANSWIQLIFMLLLCFAFPMIVLWLSKIVFKIAFLKRFESKRLTIINIFVFCTLIGFLIFDFKKKATVLIILLACALAFIVYKHLKKIIIIQFILSLMSVVTLIPLLNFASQQNNDDWAKISEEILETKFKVSPNIFVIQPDGYVNASELEKPPYNYDNSSFYSYLNTEDFTNYKHFRSNYFSTLTSNASMFAMTHHLYSNTYNKGNKTFNANKIIIGNQNNVLKVLKHNGYKTHLVTDNSYFTIDRVAMEYDYHNISKNDISFIKSKTIQTDIISELDKLLDTIKTANNFFFIEKISPSHIVRNPSKSKGINGERNAYIERLKSTNEWLKDLIKRVKKFDEDALIIIVADHGGFVGLNHTIESVKKPMNAEEVKSVFSTILSIKWPKTIAGNDTLSFKTNVNLFRKVFYSLSDNKSLLDGMGENSSFIPLRSGLGFKYYKCIDETGKYIYDQIE